MPLGPSLREMLTRETQAPCCEKAQATKRGLHGEEPRATSIQPWPSSQDAATINC